ncbi:MAG: radical SAM protein [Bacilli bacterium]|nr:radical SAM protein [Bacilli bacterium]
MKKFKKVYIEITNICNLDCSFCSKSCRKKESMTTLHFEEILKKIDQYTDYIYLHVKGEPLLHKNLDEFIYLAKKYNKYVNITTNGTLIDKFNMRLVEDGLIRQINFSLHSENNKKNYLDDIFTFSKVAKFNTNIVYRFWTIDDININNINDNILDRLILEYNLSPEVVDNILNQRNTKIDFNTYVNKDSKFVWPDSNNNLDEEKGYCYGLKDQIAILVDGTVVPCCLDGEGEIDLGNIFINTLEEILSTERVEKIVNGFRNRVAIENLCKHCNFKNKF